MTISLRWLRARLNEADPCEREPRAKVAKARDYVERLRARNCYTRDAEKRLASAEDRATAIEAARVYARSIVEDRIEEIAAIWEKPAAELLEKLEERARDAAEKDADEAEIWRVMLEALLATCDAKIARDAPERPGIAAVLAAEASFRAAPSPETLRALAAVAVASSDFAGIGAAWARIGALLALAPRGVEIVHGTPTTTRSFAGWVIEVRWAAPTRARYRFAYAPDALRDAAPLGTTSGG